MMSTVPFGSFLTTGRRGVQFRLNGGFSGLLHFWTLLYWVSISVMEGNNSRLRVGTSQSTKECPVSFFERDHSQTVLKDRSSKVQTERLIQTSRIVMQGIHELGELVLSVLDRPEFAACEPGFQLISNLVIDAALLEFCHTNECFHGK